MDSKLQAARDGLHEYRNSLEAIKQGLKAALEQYAAEMCKPLHEIEDQYSAVLQGIRQETARLQATCPHRAVIEKKFVFFRDRLCSDCGLEESAGSSRSIPTDERRRFRKLVGKPVPVDAAEYRDKRQQVRKRLGLDILSEWQTTTQEGNVLPARMVSAMPNLGREVTEKQH